MNARRRLQREIIRHRRAHKLPWPAPVFTRVTTPNGVPVRVTDLYWRTSPYSKAWRGRYVVPGATVYGPWPPTPELLRELGRWA